MRRNQSTSRTKRKAVSLGWHMDGDRNCEVYSLGKSRNTASEECLRSSYQAVFTSWTRRVRKWMLRDQLGGNCKRYLSFNVNLKKKKNKCQRIKIAYFLIFLVDSLIFFKIKVCSLGHLNGCGCWGESINQTFFPLEPNGLDSTNMVPIFFLYSSKTVLWVTAFFQLLWKFSEVRMTTQLRPASLFPLGKNVFRKGAEPRSLYSCPPVCSWIHCRAVLVSVLLRRLSVPSSPVIASLGAKPLVSLGPAVLSRVFTQFLSFTPPCHLSSDFFYSSADFPSAITA